MNMHMYIVRQCESTLEGLLYIVLALTSSTVFLSNAYSSSGYTFILSLHAYILIL